MTFRLKILLSSKQILSFFGTKIDFYHFNFYTLNFKDLNKYWKIVDDMIIEFHRTKMEQINYILQDLWAKVYQGNDIETIKIKYLEFLRKK